ncbi:MAG: FkbM family methyltransferase [Thermodesulfobacteriota bacterium]|jgi:FkbM family methyltransferase
MNSRVLIGCNLEYSLKNIHRFLQKSWPEKKISSAQLFKRGWKKIFRRIPVPVHLPYGGWWLAIDDIISIEISARKFEMAEWQFVSRFLKEGMNVLDIGAHHGFYTILASKKVRPSGYVIAFEPSPRERRWLSLNLNINHCTNVKVEPFALTSRNGKEQLFQGGGKFTGFNSLRPPAIFEPTKTIVVQTMTLDKYIEKEYSGNLNFVKIDAEGAELEILKGARKLLNRNSSPVIMIEISDVRTAAWGYSSSNICDYLSQQGYHWFSISSKGFLVPVREKVSLYNFVAVHDRSLTAVQDLIGPME